MADKDRVTKRNPVQQLDASLDEPINVEAPPTIYGTALKPELATASLNLSIDFIKQQQSLANKAMIHHAITKVVLVLALAIYLGPRVILPRSLSSASAGAIVYQFLILNRYSLGSSIGLLAVAFLCLLTTYSRISEIFFKSKISEATANFGLSYFGLNLREYVLESKEGTKEPQADNSYVIVYRQTPIAVVSLSEDKTLTTDNSLVMSISTVGCRKVYRTSGILEDLLDWSMIRTKAIAKDHKLGESMKVLVNVYSFDHHMKTTLKSKGFSRIATSNIKESKVLGGLFGFERELWGVQFHVESPKKE